jgi:hypothetical protein
MVISTARRMEAIRFLVSRSYRVAMHGKCLGMGNAWAWEMPVAADRVFDALSLWVERIVEAERLLVRRGRSFPITDMAACGRAVCCGGGSWGKMSGPLNLAAT